MTHKKFVKDVGARGPVSDVLSKLKRGSALGEPGLSLSLSLSFSLARSRLFPPPSALPPFLSHCLRVYFVRVCARACVTLSVGRPICLSA